MPSDRPILFSAPMVRAIRAGRKTQTRRVVKPRAKTMQAAGAEVITRRPPGDPWYGDRVWSMRNRDGVWGDYTEQQFLALCPYGRPGDRLWVRETWAMPEMHQQCAADLRPDWAENLLSKRLVWYRADGEQTPDPNACVGDRLNGRGRWRPSIHMPRWASRLLLEITGIRAERLGAITEEDAMAEGIDHSAAGAWRNYLWHGDPSASDRAVNSWRHQFSDYTDPRGSFSSLWESINGPGSWAADPWVWVVAFRRVEDTHA